MISPRVIALPRRLEPVSKDTFAERAADATVVELSPREASGSDDEPTPPRAA